ncbi:MAG: hypothetical protein CMO80_20100 [Verrucomicrobiales bacterium]|nr:hypothetical protein [Verrucomicrobiales bacterium]|tara:strand:- start:6137 stop:6829 length:693 start_codon:yes stop_codon:yes gene_type:complete
MPDQAKPIVETSTQEGYDLWSKVYDDEDNPLITLEMDYLDGLIGDVRGLNLLDVGCGTGRHSIRLSDAGANVTAVDFSDGMLSRAKAKSGAEEIRFVQQDIQGRLGFEDHSFDRVICCLVLDHISELDLLFREMRRVCRTEGEIVISVMHPAILLTGTRARFTDPDTGAVTYPESVPNQVSDYVMAATNAGTRLVHLSEHLVDEGLMARSERARKYQGWPLLLLMKLMPE